MSSIVLDPTRSTLAMLELHGPGVTAEPPTLDAAMTYVRGLAVSHYENFHVLSSLVPPDLRDDFAAVYAFCRWADDLGDETGNSPEARARSLQLLAWWREGLRNCFQWASHPRSGSEVDTPRPPAPTHPVYVALAHAVQRRITSGIEPLAITPFDDLVRAFELDQTRSHYETWGQLMEYCALSANPVGRIVLALAGYAENAQNAERYKMSDATCTALQLTNHWQDVRRDLLERDRVYIPSVETGVTPAELRDWAARGDDPAARVPYIKVLRGLVERTWPLFEQGRRLPGLLDRRIGPVVWLFGAGGRRVLSSVERAGCTTLWKRPTLSHAGKGLLLIRAWLMTRF